MRIVKPCIFIESNVDGDSILKSLEKSGRVCYKSEEKITQDSSKKFIEFIIDKGHETVIEHQSITVRVICDRGVTHEIVRHRLASYSQESTRYCNYSTAKFGNEISYIKPCFWDSESKADEEKNQIWEETLRTIEESYIKLIELGATAQEARSILPNSLKTEIVITMNLREWRHFFKLRTAKEAHPQMREIAIMILEKFKEEVPIIFDDFNIS